MPTVSALTDHTGYWLRMVSNAVSQALAQKVAEEGVTVAEWVFLRALHGTGTSAPSRLAEIMGMTRGAISKLADRLQAKGLVTRTDSDTDRRAHTLALTAAGRRLVPRLATLADANDAAFFAALADGDRAALERVLRALADRHRLTAAPVD